MLRVDNCCAGCCGPNSVSHSRKKDWRGLANESIGTVIAVYCGYWRKVSDIREKTRIVLESSGGMDRCKRT
jgi:hypothetical protein